MGRSWTFKACKKEAKKYKTRTQFRNRNSGCYHACQKNGWIDKVCSHMNHGAVKWNITNCTKEALKYESRLEFKQNNIGCYNACQRHGWLDKVCSHMDRKRKFNLAECMKEARKYKTRTEFFNKNRCWYDAAQRYQWLKKVCAHMATHDQDRHEENVIQPKVQSFLRSLGFKVEKEVRISKKSRVDFVCTNRDGRKILIEVKSHKKFHTQNDLTEQISRYKTEGKKKYGNRYAKTYLTSLNGRYGYSIQELKLILRQDGLI